MANQLGPRNENIFEVSFHMELADLKNFKLFKTQEIFVHGNPWHMNFKKESAGVKDSLGAYMYSKSKYTSKNSIIVANFEVEILSCKPNINAHCSSLEPCVFSSKNVNWGRNSLIPWNQLMDPANGFVMDDKCNLRIKIEATPLFDVTQNDWLTIEPIDSCDNCLQRKFRSKINKIHEFFGISSPEIMFKDLSFHVVVFRDADKLRFKIQKYGKNACSLLLTLKVISFDAKIEPKKLSGKYNFGADITSTVVYDLSTWEQLTDPAKKFIENNSFVIEVDLKIESDEPKAKKCPKCSAVFLECPICFDNMKSASVSTITTCGHMFCTKCATDALQKNGKCPSCNAVASLKSLIRSHLPTA